MPGGNMLLETFGYRPTVPADDIFFDEEMNVRCWAVEIQDLTTEQAIFQYGFTTMHGWDGFARARKEELTLAGNPETQFAFQGHVVRHTYLGRVHICFWPDDTGPACNGEAPRIHYHKIYLEPAPIPVLDWDTCLDGEEMMELLRKSQIDQRLVYAAALDCAGLCRHLVGKTRTALPALKAVEGFVDGHVTQQRMQSALQKNDAFVARRLAANSPQSLAVQAASCRPENVVSFVLRSLVYSRFNPRYYTYRYNWRYSYAKEVLAECAKMIRRHVKVAEHHQLQKLVAQRNADYAQQLVVGSPDTLARNPSLLRCYPDLDLKTLRQALTLNPNLGSCLSPHQTTQML